MLLAVQQATYAYRAPLSITIQQFPQGWNDIDVFVGQLAKE